MNLVTTITLLIFRNSTLLLIFCVFCSNVGFCDDLLVGMTLQRVPIQTISDLDGVWFQQGIVCVDPETGTVNKGKRTTAINQIAIDAQTGWFSEIRSYSEWEGSDLRNLTFQGSGIIQTLTNQPTLLIQFIYNTPDCGDSRQYPRLCGQYVMEPLRKAFIVNQQWLGLESTKDGLYFMCDKITPNGMSMILYQKSTTPTS